jgi:hypothetical protein
VNDGTLISASLTNGGTIIATKTLNQPIPGGGPGCNAPLFTIGADQDTWGLAQGTITPAMVTSGSLGISITTQLGDKRDFFAYPFAAITMNVWYSTNPCPPSIPAVCCPDQTLQVAGCNYQSVCGGSGGTLPPINSLPFPLPVLSSGLGTCGVATGATTQNYTLPFTYNGQPYYNLPILGLSSGGTCTACTIKQLP